MHTFWNLQGNPSAHTTSKQHVALKLGDQQTVFYNQIPDRPVVHRFTLDWFPMTRNNFLDHEDDPDHEHNHNTLTWLAKCPFLFHFLYSLMSFLTLDFTKF